MAQTKRTQQPRIAVEIEDAQEQTSAALAKWLAEVALEARVQDDADAA
ncbi:MAG TPA: hypothetical protein VI814_09970 [Candidatus Limnocylindria bacterium]